MKTKTKKNFGVGQEYFALISNTGAGWFLVQVEHSKPYLIDMKRRWIATGSKAKIIRVEVKEL